MADLDNEDTRLYTVLVNEEEQYSLWLKAREILPPVIPAPKPFISTVDMQQPIRHDSYVARLCIMNHLF